MFTLDIESIEKYIAEPMYVVVVSETCGKVSLMYCAGKFATKAIAQKFADDLEDRKAMTIPFVDVVTSVTVRPYRERI